MSGELSPPAIVAVAWALAAALMAGLWLWHRRLGNVGVVDVGWTLGVVVASLLFAITGTGSVARRSLIAAMVAIWGLRLATHLLRDRVLGRPEDPRYTEMRERGSWAAGGNFFPFFQAQALLAVFMALPAWLASSNPDPRVAVVEWAAVALWAVGLTGEAAADRQLARFKTKPESRGRTCRDGLWRYSRHPNYFFEWVIWMAFALFASPPGSGRGLTPLLAWLCPTLMLYLLFRVTGIPATEAQAVRSRGDDYRRYQATTSAFFPWLPRRAE
jgi:steroid 5-alpha reductase family enzyme